jgi:hypothetical protein
MNHRINVHSPPKTKKTAATGKRPAGNGFDHFFCCSRIFSPSAVSAISIHDFWKVHDLAGPEQVFIRCAREWRGQAFPCNRAWGVEDEGASRPRSSCRIVPASRRDWSAS